MIDNLKPLKWGQTTKEMQKSFPSALLQDGGVRLGSIYLTNFPGDCGTLILQQANSATKENLKQAIKLASLNGFNKIFATVVAADTYYFKLENTLEAFKANRFIKVKHSKSNRNPYKDDIVFVKYISNCKYKGY